jgi:acetyltransferase-like isoleucine patch superfamily enzyme/acyl carrier protein
MLSHQVVRGASRLVNRLQAELALRGIAKCDGEVRLIGRPFITSAGTILFGRGAILVSEPAPVRLTIARGGVLEVGAEVVIGSGTTIVARGHVRVGAGAELGPHCIVTDAEDADAAAPVGPIEIGAGARLGAGVTLLKGAIVPAGARVARGAIIRAGGERANVGPAVPSALGANKELLHRVRRIVSSVVQSGEEAEPDQEMWLWGGWNSLSAIHVLVALESEFGVVLPSNLFERAKTLAAIGEAVGVALARSVESPPSGVRARAGA